MSNLNTLMSLLNSKTYSNDNDRDYNDVKYSYFLAANHFYNNLNEQNKLNRLTLNPMDMYADDIILSQLLQRQLDTLLNRFKFIEPFKTHPVVVVVTNKTECGMPHTIGKFICIPSIIAIK